MNGNTKTRIRIAAGALMAIGKDVEKTVKMQPPERASALRSLGDQAKRLSRQLHGLAGEADVEARHGQ